MKIDAIDKPSLKVLRPAIEKALNDAGIEGVTFRLGSATYSPGSHATFKLEVSQINQDGSVETKDAAEYHANAKWFGLPEDGLGKIIVLRGDRYEIVGLAPRSRKYPVLVRRCRDKKTYKYPLYDVQRALGLKPVGFGFGD